MTDFAEREYPYVAKWVKTFGYIEIGHDDFSRSFIRVLDIGGMIWEGAPSYPTLDDALQAADDTIRDWLIEQGFEKQ
jgi:hypothetical protein